MSDKKVSLKKAFVGFVYAMLRIAIINQGYNHLQWFYNVKAGVFKGKKRTRACEVLENARDVVQGNDNYKYSFKETKVTSKDFTEQESEGCDYATITLMLKDGQEVSIYLSAVDITGGQIVQFVVS